MDNRAAGQIPQKAARYIVLLGSAILALLVGTFVYLVDRDWASTQFLSPLAALQGDPAAFFGALGQVLPSFCHAYAFTLLLIMALGASRHARPFGAAVWFAIAAGLELLQAGRMQLLAQEPTALLAGSPLANSVRAYVVNGHFDSGDLIAAAVGCLAAYIVSSVLEVPK